MENRVTSSVSTVSHVKSIIIVIVVIIMEYVRARRLCERPRSSVVGTLLQRLSVLGYFHNLCEWRSG